MAWSFEDLSAVEQDRLANDKPMMVVQKIPMSPSYVKWVEDDSIGSGDITTWTDRSATANPPRRAFDGLPGLVTKPGVSPADSGWVFAYDLGSLVTFDSVFIAGHNFGTLGVTFLEVWIADDNAWSVSETIIADTAAFGGAPADDSRLKVLSLSHGADGTRAHDTGADGGPNIYTAQYVWVKLLAGGNIIPEIGELVLGRRVQLGYKPDRPYDEYAFGEDSKVDRSPGGVIQKTVYARRWRELVANIRVDDPDDEDNLVQWFRDTRGSFVWVENPNSAPDGWSMMVRDGGFALPRNEPNVRDFHLESTEQGPEEYYLDVEANG